MMHGSFEGQKHISVFETTLSIQQNTLSVRFIYKTLQYISIAKQYTQQVFNIIIQSSQSTVSLIRYPFDLVEFHQKVKFALINHNSIILKNKIDSLSLSKNQDIFSDLDQSFNENKYCRPFALPSIISRTVFAKKEIKRG